MVTVLITVCLMLAFVEIYSLGVYVLAIKAGERNAVKCFIPFYAFSMVRTITGPFKVLTIPVERYGGMMIECFSVILVALIYACWGQEKLPIVSAESLWQIMTVVFVLLGFIVWVSLLISSERLFRRFNVERKSLFVAICALVITIPLVYIAVSKNTPRDLKDMY